MPFRQLSRDIATDIGCVFEADTPTQLLQAGGSPTPSVDSHTTWGHFVVELLQCTTSLPKGTGQGENLRHTTSMPWGRAFATKT